VRIASFEFVRSKSEKVRGGGHSERLRGAKCFPIGRARRCIAHRNSCKHTANQIFFNGTSVAFAATRTILFFPN
jgi:hypothetical protein